jgi:hypothetical protein
MTLHRTSLNRPVSDFDRSESPNFRLIMLNVPEVEQAWREGRAAHAVAAYTAAEMVFRKILMHVAMDKAAPDPGKGFIEYVNDLQSGGYITTGLKDVVDQIRTRGNTANHETTRVHGTGLSPDHDHH